MKKSWKHLGEVTKEVRPKNSLLNANIIFDQTRPTVPVTHDVESEFKKIMQLRIKEKKFDNHIIQLNQKKDDIFENDENKEVVDEEKNLDEGEDNGEMTREEMVELFWDIDGILNQICDFGGTGVFGVDKITEKSMFDDKKEDKRHNNKMERRKREGKIVKNLKKVKNVKVLY